MLKKIGKLTTIKKKTSDPKVPPGQYATEKFPVLTFGPTFKLVLHEDSSAPSAVLPKVQGG